MEKKGTKPRSRHIFDAKKQLFIEIMKKKLGNTAKACAEMEITRQTFYDWRQACPEFVKALSTVKEMCKDLAEDTVLVAIKGGDVKAAQFYLDRQAKDREYGDQKEVVHSTGNLDSLKEALDDAIRQYDSDY